MSRRLPGKLDDPTSSRTPRAWIARTTLDSMGSRVDNENASGAVDVMTICVHQSYDIGVDARLALMRQVASRGHERGWVRPGAPSLWVFPAGYFGFDASKSRGLKSGSHGSACRDAWPGLSGHDLVDLEQKLQVVWGDFPRGAWIAVGVDMGHDRQCAWLIHDGRDGRMSKEEIVRGATGLESRKFTIGNLRAAFFVCGEVTGTGTSGGGPFCAGEYLRRPIRQMSDCRLLVDLAHLRVPGAVTADRPNPRWIHQRQLETFAAHGAAVLTHHHEGYLIGKRARFEHQSNWIVYRGGKWLDSKDVEPIP